MKESSYFPHYSTSKDDPNCVLLIDQLGLEGYGIYWILIETLRAQENFRYPLKLIPSLARRYGTSQEKMKTVILNFELFQVEETDFFCSDDLNKAMNEIAIKRLKQSKGGQKAMLNRWKSNLKEKENDNIDISKLLNSDNIHITSKVNESKEKESKEKESKQKKESPLIFEVLESEVPDNEKDYFKKAKAFYDLINKNLLEIGINSSDLKKSKYADWIKTIRLMQTSDKRTDEELRQVFKYLNEEPTGEGFTWKANIRSVATLREKFEKILISSKQPKIKANGQQADPYKNMRADLNAKYSKKFAETFNIEN